MKVIDKAIVNGVVIEMLNPGDCFLYPVDGEYYLRTVGDGGQTRPAVCLRLGVLQIFSCGVMVIPMPHAEIHV